MRGSVDAGRFGHCAYAMLVLSARAAYSAGGTDPLGVEVVPDAPHVTGLNRHVGEIWLARAAANFDAMHPRLEMKCGDRRCRAVVPAIDVEIASGRYREDEPRRFASLLHRDFFCSRFCRLRDLRRRRSAG